ncbi:nuclear transport factor 2 family protein [Bradyrhizobium sp. ORS 111]|uniref:nuclear transport factor 2 family protein n=1 Tax=Bradyrhizobium sp. ORS 111 TaxID=1685958 RepID=UPI00388EC813
MSDLHAFRQALLQQLFAAFNRHDSGGVMACMTDDVIFDAAAGPEMCGRRITGAMDVRAAFERTFADMPDASWQCTRHAVFGNRALSEWIFRATTKDGSRIEAQGCDLFQFSGDKICVKSAFRKERPLQTAVQPKDPVRS